MGTLKDWINKLDNRLIGSTQWSMQETKKKNEQKYKNLWNIVKNSSVYIIGFRKGKKIDWDRAIFEQIVVENFP